MSDTPYSITGSLRAIRSRITALTLHQGLSRDAWSELCRLDTDLAVAIAATEGRWPDYEVDASPVVARSSDSTLSAADAARMAACDASNAARWVALDDEEVASADRKKRRIP